MLGRILRARARLFLAILVGLISIPLIRPHLAGVSGTLACWDIGVLAYLLLAAQMFATVDPEHMPANAERQQEGEWTIFSITVATIVASVAAIISEFSVAKGASGDTRGLHVALVGATLLLSWLMTHTSFTFRYAHEYYSTTEGVPSDPKSGVDGGLEFPEEPLPDYFDFFYFAIVLGMTFQVSDVQITSRKFRRMATVHGLLSFLFNTIILALTINIIAGLL